MQSFHAKPRGDGVIRGLLQLVCLAAMTAIAAPVVAADLANGQALFSTYCAQCHGANPTIGSPSTVANDPAGLDRAIANVPQMGFLESLLDANDRIDVTAFIGDALGLPQAPPYESGWYWNENESGRGFFIEFQGDAFFMAGFHYEPDGRATWFTAQGQRSGPMLDSPMFMFRDGQTLSGAYRAPVATTPPGNLSIVFEDSDSPTMTWIGGNTPLQRFGFTAGSVVAPPQAGAPESGWWWYDRESGRGYAIEFQGDAVFVAGFMYADNGDPTWYVISGTMQSPRRYVGTWLAFTGGPAPSRPYTAPVRTIPDPGTVTLDFSDATHGTMSLPDGRVIPLTRFDF